MKTTVAETGELELVAEICRRCNVEGDDIEIGPGDDAAVWRPEGTVVATIDSIVCGTDWLAEHTPAADIGHRAIAVSLSDLAAMWRTVRDNKPVSWGLCRGPLGAAALSLERARSVWPNPLTFVNGLGHTLPPRWNFPCAPHG